MTYRTFDLMTLEERDPLPLTKVRFGAEQNSNGGFSASLPIATPQVQKIDFRSSTLTGRTLLVAEYEQQPVWGGIVWTRKYKKTEQALTIGATTLGSYFNSRLQAADYTTTWSAGASATAIIKKVVEDANTVSHALKVNVTLHKFVAGEGSPVKVSYPLQTPQTVTSLLTLLADMGLGTGFDWSFDVTYAPGTFEPELTFNIWYPLQGLSASETDVILLGSDCVDFEWPEDSTNQAWIITETGNNGLKGTADYTVPGETGYPLLEALKSRTNVSELVALAEATLGDLSAYAWPVTVPAFELPLFHIEEGKKPGWLSFNSLGMGDEFTFSIDPAQGGGRNVDPRFPEGIESVERLGAYSATISDTGLSTLTYVAQPPPAENGSPPEPPALSS